MMKRIIVSFITVALITGASFTMLPNVSSGAASITATNKAADNSGTWNPIVPGQNVKALVRQAEASFLAAHPGVSISTGQKVGSISNNASVSIGVFTALLSLNHGDVGSIITKAFLAGLAAEFAYLCGFLPGFITTGVCIFAVAASASYINQLLVNAYNQVTWVADFACGWNWYCSTPGAQPTVFGWIMPVHITGLNILFTWGGIPIGFQYN